MTVRWVDILGQLARSIAMVGIFDSQIPQGYHVPHFVGNPHQQIPNSSVRTNSSATRRTSSLSLKKLTKLYEISNGFTRRDWQVQDFKLSITWKIFLSISSTPFNGTVFPMTQERQNETTKTKVFTLHIPQMNTKSSRSHHFFTFNVFRKSSEIQSLQSKNFIFRGRLSL